MLVQVYVVLFFILSRSSSPQPVTSDNTLCYLIIIAVLCFTVGALHFSNLFSNTIPPLHPGPYLPKPLPSAKGEVFNIPGNYYTYDESHTLCKAYNARLATYDEIEQAYNSGADWCNYGWADKQLALFPTQKKTYNTLQGITGHGNDCGRPGVNGGYIANPNVKFGATCFGKKPKMTAEEQELMQTSAVYPKTAKDAKMEAQLKIWSNKKDEILVSPFSHTSWSRY